MLSNKFSIQTILTIMIIGISFLALFISIVFTLFYNFKNEKDSFMSQNKLQTILIADFIVTPLAFFDKAAVKENLKFFEANSNINFVIVFDEYDKEFTSFNLKENLVPKRIIKQEQIKFSQDGTNMFDFGKLDIWYPLKQNDKQYGMLYIQYNTESLSKIIENMIYIFSLFATVLLLLVIVGSRLLSQQLLKPIFNLIDGVERIHKTQTYDVALVYDANNEISVLYKALNSLFHDLDYHQKNLIILNESLELRVEERTKDLEKNVSELKRTQFQLVESEKMAALGGLVSGVAHEVNTPLGNALTGASIIKHETQVLYSLFESNNLKKSILQTKLKLLEETSSLLMKTVTQASNLIRSFKRISIDQTQEEMREFNLYEYIQEIFLTFSNKLKQVPVHVFIDGDKSLMIYSYPGFFAQIMNNLIQNALIHAFPVGYKNASIILNFEHKGDELIVHFKDNGVGVDKKISNKLFEPFVTTKRNAGGTGLGLNIVYNIVSQKLNGSIGAYIDKENETVFKIIIPLQKDRK